MKYTQKNALRWMVAMGLTMTAFSWGNVEAMPTGGEVRSGDAEIKTSGQTMDIDQKTSRVALDWTGFDIAKGETVRFHQNPSDIAINRILGNKASEIYGSLLADGTVFLLNPQGILFGQGAQVDVGNLIASTAQVDDSFMKGFSAGGDVSLNLGEASKGKVINAGDIKAQGGLVALHATNVENTGSIKNDGGNVSLSAVKNLELAIDTAGKINFETSGETANAHTLNAGTIQADGGYVVMTAKSAGDMLSEVVNNTGIIEAKTASINDKGEILLDGGDHGTVNVSGKLDASGLAEGQSGGNVRIVGENTHVKDGAKLTASGDKDGGLVETSGDVLDVSTKASIEAKGRTGKAGEWLLDPLDVVISNDATSTSNIFSKDGNGNINIDCNNTSEKAVKSYINAGYVQDMLNSGTGVKIQAIDSKGAANIVVSSPITKKDGKDTYLTLQAQRNVIVKEKISSESGKLTITLHADTDGDQKGMVVIAADINTNGGDFVSGTGIDIKNGTVGTYFGPYDVEKNMPANTEGVNTDLMLETKGGAVNLYGDVALGLNDGKLTIKTANDTGNGGVNITGNVDSLNTYKTFVNNKNSGAEVKWDEDLQKIASIYYKNHLQKIVFLTFDKFYELAHSQDENNDIYKTLYKEVEERCFSQYGGKTVKEVPQNEDERKSVMTTYFTTNISLGIDKEVEFKDLATKSEYTDAYNKLASHILTTCNYENNLANRESILNRWENAKESAKEGTSGGAAIGDKYLATITTSLENWIVNSRMEGKKYELFLGGRTDYKGSKDITSGREFRWETGPEGLQNPEGKGTVFFTSSGIGKGTVAENMYQGWSHDNSGSNGKKYNEPNNNSKWEQPYLAMGWLSDTGWADVDNQMDLVKGFIQETNSTHSSLDVQSGTDDVTIGGNIGKSAVLKELNIQTDGAVKIGGGINIATLPKDSTTHKYTFDNAETAGGKFTGQVHVDNNANIRGGKGVDVGDRITSTAGGVTITSAGNVVTNGITAKDKVQLVTSGQGNGIAINKSIDTKSTAKDAVIIDAHDGHFINKTTGENAIRTGAGGRWKIYSNSPDNDKFGTNLNSNTYALWGRNDSAKYAYKAFADDSSTTAGRYIFNIAPVITLTADDVSKVYGDALNPTDWNSVTIEKTYDNMPFTQDTITKADVQALSDGQAAKADVGSYAIKGSGFEKTSAAQHGYVLKTVGTVNVTPRPIDVAVELTGTYGSDKYTNKVVSVENLAAWDNVTDVAYTLADSYRSQLRDGAVTGNVGDYENAVKATGVTFKDDTVAKNYSINYKNAKLTIQPREVVLDLTGQGISLDSQNIHVNGIRYESQLVNGDTLATAPVVTYRIGSAQDWGTYGIDLYVDGAKVNSGDVSGNYRFNYTGVYKQDNIERPQFDYVITNPRRGTASYDTNTEPRQSSVEKVLGLTTAKLPVMRDFQSKVTRYGTYQLTVDPDKVTLELADKDVPLRVNSIHDQYREYTKNLTTKRGAADFKLSYDGSIFALHPIGQKAEKMLEAGDAAHNVDVVSQALYTAFHDMGLTLDDLDAVYVCFA